MTIRKSKKDAHARASSTIMPIDGARFLGVGVAETEAGVITEMGGEEIIFGD